MPIKGASLIFSRLRLGDQTLKHRHKIVDRSLAFDVVFFRVPPELVFPDCRLGQIGLLLEIEIDDSGADVGAADIDGENGVMRLEHPGRRQMRGTEQTGLVRIVADRNEVDLDLVCFQNDARRDRSRVRRCGWRESRRR